MTSWSSRSSPLMALKAVFPHEKRDKCKPHDWRSRGCQLGKQSFLLKQSAGLCFSSLLPLLSCLFSRHTAAGVQMWPGLDMTTVQMWPGSGCCLLHPFNPRVCRGRFLQLSPHPQQNFSQQEGEMRRVCLALNTHRSRMAFSACSEQVCVSTTTQRSLDNSTKWVWLTWVNRLKMPCGGTLDRDHRANKLREKHQCRGRVHYLSSCFQDTSKTRRSLDGLLGVCVSLKSLQSPCYQEWAPLTKHPGSKHLVRNSWDIQCLLIQDPALGFSQVLASFLPPCLVNIAFAVKDGQRLGYLITKNIYSW